MLANTQQVAEAARAAGATVMHAPITFAEGYNEISARFSQQMSSTEFIAEPGS